MRTGLCRNIAIPICLLVLGCGDPEPGSTDAQGGQGGAAGTTAGATGGGKMSTAGAGASGGTAGQSDPGAAGNAAGGEPDVGGGEGGAPAAIGGGVDFCEWQCAAGCSLGSMDPGQCVADCLNFFDRGREGCPTLMRPYLDCVGDDKPVFYCPDYDESSPCYEEAVPLVACINNQ